MNAAARWWFVGWLLIPGCAVSKPTPEPVRPDPVIEAAAAALVAAAPGDWPAHLDAVHAHGTAASAALVRALGKAPDGPGAQAALHLLGRLRAPGCRPFLERRAAAGDELAAEAALALGRLGDTASIRPLRALVDDRLTPPTTRCAAAAALIELGRAREVLPFLDAVWTAATPYGHAHGRAVGFPPSKDRWAHERYMIIEAIRHRYGGKTFGLDEDQPWEAMRDAGKRFRDAVESSPR